eukprot:352812-Pleurochrysis_carterae.AAC.2
MHYAWMRAHARSAVHTRPGASRQPCVPTHAERARSNERARAAACVAVRTIRSRRGSASGLGAAPSAARWPASSRTCCRCSQEASAPARAATR